MIGATVDSRSIDLNRILSDSGLSRIGTTEKGVSLEKARREARQAALAEYIKQYLHLIEVNVVGHTGVSLQCRFKAKNGSLRAKANDSIEQAFAAWTEGRCDVTQTMSWVDIQTLVAKGLARDGEALVRIVRSPDINDFGIALQLLEPWQLDENCNQQAGYGQSQIVAGVELNEWLAPVAYHIRGNTRGYERVRIPRRDILHIYKRDTAHQVRGFPWFYSAIEKTKILDGYIEAEMVAARVASCQGGFFEESEGSHYTGDGTNDDGDIIRTVEPGQCERLPPGVKFVPYRPEHPTNAFDSFVKGCVRAISAGLHLSYPSISQDLTGVSYSSIRAGFIAERDYYKTLQTFLISHLCQPVYESFLEMAILTGKIKIPIENIDQFRRPRWLGRRWEWVDPLKDINANESAVKNGFKSRSEVCDEQGRDYEQVLIDRKTEQELEKKYGITMEAGDDAANVPIENADNAEGDSEEGQE